MNFPAALFPSELLLICNGFMALLLLCAAVRVPWRRLDGATLGAFGGATVLLAAMWQLQTGLQPGLSFHLLGAAMLTLLMDMELALLALGLMLALLAAAGRMSWPALGLNFCVSLLPPVLLVTALLRMARRRLPANLFVYVFVNAFLGGGLSLLLAAVCGMLLLLDWGIYDWAHLVENALPFYGLLAWSEAFSSGLLLSILVVYRPQWVRTFDDAHYLKTSY